VFFFSPDTNVNNFSTLKGEFDSCFATAGNHKFQPFADRAAFEAALKEKRAGLFLMSSWHFAQYPDKAGFDPALIGVLRGKSTQRHSLCAKKNVPNAGDLRGLTIASAGTRELTVNRLREILGKDQDALISSFNLLAVPKDMDALMSVGVGVAQAAVATESGLGRLAKTNAKQHEQLNAIATGPEDLLHIVVAPSMPDASCQALLKVLSSIPPDREGGKPPQAPRPRRPQAHRGHPSKGPRAMNAKPPPCAQRRTRAVAHTAALAATLITGLAAAPSSNKVLVLNSDASISRYLEVQKSFNESLPTPAVSVDYDQGRPDRNRAAAHARP
jgi:hypothetical protein